ncbi:MAG: protein kinase [Deltaproteobacteria bacterium]|nr:protein kinase [Deltaproteobacteria bacterium]
MPLGRGATAQVFRATRKSDGVEVALKVFHPDVWEEKELKRRVVKEAKIVSELEHPNIIRVLDTHFDCEPPALAMELVDGVSLEQFQPRLPYILPEIGALVVLDVLAALAHAHAANVIHRDLKPANILVSKCGKVCVADFGLAKTTNLTQATMSGTVLGSPDFMSPEQALGDVVTPRSDIFSLSAVLYFLVTGTRPFSRASALSTLAAVSRVEIEPVQRRNPKLSPELARIIHKGLAKDATDRFQSADEYAQALRAYLESLGLDLTQLTLGAWVSSPTIVTADALRTISESLAARCERAIAKREWTAALELLSHLGQVAPESGAIPRLIDALESGQSRERRKLAFVRASAGVAGALALVSVVVYVARHVRFESDGAKPAAPVAIQRQDETVVPAKQEPAAPGSVVPAAALRKAIAKSQVPARAATPVAPVVSAVSKPADEKQQRGRVELTIPPGIKVFWDGREIDASQPITNVRPGEHNLRMEREGTPPINSTIDVKASEPTVIKVR